MNSKVIPTPGFARSLKRLAKKHRSLGADVCKLTAELEQNPFLGDRVGEETYKVHLAIRSKGRGKSGGALVICSIRR